MTILKHELDGEGYNAVPENLRSIYTAAEGDEGKYVVPENLRPVADALTGLFSANKKARDDVKNWERKGAPDLSDLKDFGDDLPTIKEGIKSRISELEELVAKGKDGKIDLDKMRQEMKSAHQKELETKDKTNEALRGTVHKYLVTSAATEALNSEDGISELALPFVTQNVKVIEEDGDFRAIVIDGDGDPRISGGTGQPMTIRELVKEMKGQEKYAPLFKSQAKSGGGAQPGKGAAPASAGTDASPIDKIKAGLKKRAA